MAADPKQLKRRFEALRARRSELESHCEDVAEVISPRHLGFTGRRIANEKRMNKVYDSTGISSNELLAAGLHGLLTNPATKWFSLRLVGPGLDDDDAVKAWLSEVSDVLRAYMYAPGTNLTTALHETYLETGAFGTALLFIGERDAGGLLFQPRPLSECFIAENHEGMVDTVYRRTVMTARQVLQQFGDKNVSADIRKTVYEANKPDDPVEIVHAVYPRSDRERNKRNKLNQPYASCYIEVKTEHLLEESGFAEFPYAVPRWSKLPGEEYGRSPAMTALPDVKMLQEMMKTTIKAAQKVVDPTLMVPDDGAVGPIRTVPGGLIFMRDPVGRPIVPLATGGNIPLSMEMMEELRGRIRTTFFADLMQFPTDVQMTATEFSQRMSERMRLLGPVLGRMEGEMLARIIERSLGILGRMGVLPAPPASIAERELTVEFVSPIALAQKQSEANAFALTMQTVAPYIQLTQDPSPLERFKASEIVPWIWELNGGDPDLVYSDDEYADIQEAKQLQQQAMMAAQAAQPMAQAAHQGASAIDKMASAQQKGADLSQMMPQAA